ncbi:MAG: chemotaxis protein CheX [Pseudomonadota bacterium]
MSALTAAEIKVFVDAVIRYFDRLTGDGAVVSASYLADTAIPRSDYTGLITFSGRFRGCIYCSAPRAMLPELLAALGEPDVSEPNLLDAVGELTNTIAGNARSHFGDGLEISVPVTIRGTSERIRAAVRARPYAIVVRWRRHDIAVVVDLERE